MSIGENIKRIRSEKKITQRQLGELSGISYKQIGLYEQGVRNPKLETIQKIAKALDTSYLELIYDETIEETTKQQSLELERLKTKQDLINIAKKSIDLQEELNKKKEKIYKINKLMNQLNDKGQDKAIENVELLTKIDEYTKKE